MPISASSLSQSSLLFSSVFLAYANPSSVLYSSETKLSCDAGGLNADYVWLTPQSKQHCECKDVNVTDVTADEAGLWTCCIKNKQGKEIVQLQVPVTVVGMFLLMALPCYECKSQLGRLNTYMLLCYRMFYNIVI